MKELHVTLNTIHCLWIDNIVSFSLSSKPIFYAKIKHVEMDYHFIHEENNNKDIQARHISTRDQNADIFISLSLYISSYK